ncbi:pentatricopeptide repeat-containing protein At5g61370, mitochondrial [Nymphaea colorata]|nr:pentatricopeptide repeat-containing protein At5g61370, mitochondrial [Nymphaea colorata]XP_049932702.1 pentatricopeptide repeat-containing protein At5g61370, mitochondrial [Nymphaea colorata]XP_049932703.1 pentatricopeptide repeat-containing protein At5g61370, mitochondrial [Nymphaea colorata]XP_049932704.1 pentatricopeptide repeat-containing protein At5g61370, mitochondrial [Nymphaea colorata]XP_049932705.1 pentatricopeptide repeat-containing protein At5g61370, mitochondrial [Nymphaea color
MLKPTRIHLVRQLSQSFSQLVSFCTSLGIEKVCQIVSGVGSLEDLEASLNQSGVQVTKDQVTQVVYSCKDQVHPRRLLRFFMWSRQKSSSDLGDVEFNFLIRIFAEKGDLTAIEILLHDLKKERRKMDVETWGCLVDTLVRFGKEDDAVGLFKNIESLNCPRDKGSFTKLVHALCQQGHAKKAEQVVWRSKNMFGMGPTIYTCLVHGWCLNGNVKEAKRVLNEMRNESIAPGILIYNDLLRCICEKNVKCNPSALVQDANDLMMEMRSSGVFPSSVSFNILLSCLSRVRRVKEACHILLSMKSLGCAPDWMTYFLVVRLLYLTGRIVRGNRIVDEMFNDGLVPSLRFYHDLIGVLCGVDQVGHALAMFARMKRNCPQECGPMYDLLIEKLCRSGEFEKGKQLWDEAVEAGFILQCSANLLNPMRTRVFKPIRKLTKMELEECRSVLNAITKEDEIATRKKRKKQRKGSRLRR